MIHRLLGATAHIVHSMTGKEDDIPPHPHSWWNSTEVQAALAGGVCLIIAYALSAWIKSRKRRTKTHKDLGHHGKGK